MRAKGSHIVINGLHEFRDDLLKAPEYLRQAMSLPDFIVMTAVLVFCLVTMYYADMTVTGPFSVLLWDALTDGKPFSFYDLCLASGIAPEGAVYDFGLYLVFAVWNFPIWVLYRLAGISLTSTGALLWYKFLPVLYTLACVSAVVSLAGHVLPAGKGTAARSPDNSGERLLRADTGKKQDSCAAGALFLLSLLTVLPVFVTAQYDCIPLYFMLKGVNAWLSGNDRAHHRRFLYWFALSLVMKPMGILILLLLIILREKNFFRIILEMLEGCSVLIVCKLLCSVSAGYRTSTGGFLEQHLPDLVQAQIEGGYGAVSVFVLGLGVLYFTAYLYRWEAHAERVNRQISIAFIYGIWAVFCAFGNMTPYWCIYLAPFLILVMMESQHHRNALLLADLAGELCLTAVLILKFPWVYGGEKTFAYLILKPLCGKILDGSRSVTVAGALRGIHMEELLPCLNACVTAWLLVTGVSAAKEAFVREPGYQYGEKRPGESREDPAEGASDSIVFHGHSLCVLHGHIRIRILWIMAWVVLCLMAFRYML